MTAANTHVDPWPTIVFTRDWNQLLLGELAPGGSFSIVYDPVRLAEAADAQPAPNAERVTAFAQFQPPDGPVAAHPLSPLEGEMLGGTLGIPEDAEELVLWFAGAGPSGGERFDSRFGENYRFRFPRRDVVVVSALLSAEGDDEYGGLSVAVETPPAVSGVGLEYSIPSDQGPYPPRGCICLEVTGEKDRRKHWSISEYMVPSRDGVEFAVYYQIGGARFRDDNGGRGYQAVAARPA